MQITFSENNAGLRHTLGKCYEIEEQQELVLFHLIVNFLVNSVHTFVRKSVLASIPPHNI